MKTALSRYVLGLPLLFGTACTSYYVPTSAPEVVVNLASADIESMSEVRGTGSSFFLILPLSSGIATQEAIHDATKKVSESLGADFLISPRVKITHYWFLIGDYATAEVVGKAVRLRPRTKS